jgi:hypothetical protein
MNSGVVMVAAKVWPFVFLLGCTASIPAGVPASDLALSDLASPDLGDAAMARDLLPGDLACAGSFCGRDFALDDLAQ